MLADKEIIMAALNIRSMRSPTPSHQMSLEVNLCIHPLLIFGHGRFPPGHGITEGSQIPLLLDLAFASNVHYLDTVSCYAKLAVLKQVSQGVLGPPHHSTPGCPRGRPGLPGHPALRQRGGHLQGHPGLPCLRRSSSLNTFLTSSPPPPSPPPPPPPQPTSTPLRCC